MKILYISYDGLFDQVVQSQVIPYLEKLSGKGIEFTLLTFEKKINLNKSDELKAYSEKLRNKKIRWIFKKYHKRPAIPATLFDILQGILEGILVIPKNKIDIIHSRGYISALIGFPLGCIFRKKVIFDMRGFWADEKVDAGSWKLNGFLYKIFKKIEKFLIEKSDKIIVLTHEAAEFISKNYNIKSEIEIIPCCVDTFLFYRYPGDAGSYRDFYGKFVVNYSGNLGSFYNLGGILDFFLYLKKKNINTFLWLATNYPKDIILKEASKKGVASCDIRVDSLNYSEMAKALSCSDLSLIFYKRKLSGMGCSPIKFAESLACGVPVVVNTGIGDCDKIIEANNIGVVLKDFNEEEYNKAMYKINNLFSKKEELISRCIGVANNDFSLEKGAEKYFKVYKSLES